MTHRLNDSLPISMLKMDNKLPMLPCGSHQLTGSDLKVSKQQWRIPWLRNCTLNEYLDSLPFQQSRVFILIKRSTNLIVKNTAIYYERKWMPTWIPWFFHYYSHIWFLHEANLHLRSKAASILQITSYGVFKGFMVYFWRVHVFSESQKSIISWYEEKLHRTY